MTRRRLFLELSLIVVALLFLTLPFSNKAYNVDDGEFLAFSKVQLEDPLQFHLEGHQQFGRYFEKFRTTHPPLLSSYYATVMWLSSGESEVVLHCAFLLFPMIAAFSMYSLGRRFCSQPLAASLLLLVMPGFLVMSHMLMGDVPGMALWLAASASFIWGVDKSNKLLLMSASFILAFATLTAYQALAALPLLLLYAAIKRRIDFPVIITLVFPLIVFFIYSVFLGISTGGPPRFTYSRGITFGWGSLDTKARSILAFLGGASIFPLLAPAGFIRSRADTLIALPVAGLVVIFGVVLPAISGIISVEQAIILSVFVVSGTAMIYGAIKPVINGIRRNVEKNGVLKDELFLGVWILVVILYIYAILPYVSVRYLLPMFPPLIFLFIAGVERLLKRRRSLRQVFLASTIILTLLLALPVAIADYRLSNTTRDMAERFRHEYSESDQEVWLLGEFGFRYYMEKHGFPYLGVNSVAESGDLVIASERATGVEPNIVVMPPPPEYSVVLDRIAVKDDFPVRLTDPVSGAAFYSDRTGPLPYMFALTNTDIYTIYRLAW